MTEETIVYKCDHIGVAGTTPCHIQKTEEGYEARIGVALFGMSNFNKEDFERVNYNPFHDEFYDNYCSGKGQTEEEAIEELKADMKDMADSLWVI